MTKRREYNHTDLDCIQIWQKDLKRVCRYLYYVNAKAAMAKEAYETALAWELILKTFWENIQQTDSLAKDVFEVIYRFKGFTQKVSGNAEKTNEALEILLCDMQDILDYSYKVQYVVYQLIQKIQHIVENRGLEGSSKVLECLIALKDKLVAAITLVQEAFVIVAETIESGTKFYECMVTDSGILQNLKELHQLLREAELPYYYQGVDVCNSCDSKIEPKPQFLLAECKDEYYEKCKEQYEEATSRTSYWLGLYEYATKKQELLQARKESLEEAIRKASMAKVC